MSGYKKILEELIDGQRAGAVVPPAELRAILGQNVHGKRLTERIIRCLLICNEHADPGMVLSNNGNERPPEDAVELLAQVHRSQALLDSPEVGADDLHDRIGMELQRLTEMRSGGGGPVEAPVEPRQRRPIPAEEPRSTPPPPPDTPPAPEPVETPPAPTPEAEIDPFATLFGEEPAPEPEPDEEEDKGEVRPVVLFDDDDYRVQTGSILNALDKATGQIHVYAAGTAVCLSPGHGGVRCAFAVKHLNK